MNGSGTRDRERNRAATTARRRYTNLTKLRRSLPSDVSQSPKTPIRTGTFLERKSTVSAAFSLSPPPLPPLPSLRVFSFSLLREFPRSHVHLPRRGSFINSFSVSLEPFRAVFAARARNTDRDTKNFRKKVGL